ncbi:MAG: DNA polymerase Y family protein, partial [Wenzhouxiangella sp.]
AQLHAEKVHWAQRLNDAGILTVGQLRSTAPDLLVRLFGAQGLVLVERAWGRDDRPVKPDRIRRSISQENTFGDDVHDLAVLRKLIGQQAAEVAARLDARRLQARTVTLKLRSSGFSTITRSQSLALHTRSAEVIAQTACTMLKDWSGWRKAFSVRLIGVGVSGLEANPDPLAEDEG